MIETSHIVTQDFWIERDVLIRTAFAQKMTGDRYWYIKSDNQYWNKFSVDVVENKIVCLTSEHTDVNMGMYSMAPDHEHSVIIKKFKLNDLPIDIQ